MPEQAPATGFGEIGPLRGANRLTTPRLQMTARPAPAKNMRARASASRSSARSAAAQIALGSRTQQNPRFCEDCDNLADRRGTGILHARCRMSAKA